MKKLFVSLVAIVMATMSYAQNVLVATLTHGDEIKMFYGTYALQQAHAAATDGDIINLSGGGFQSVKITKALTVRGTGVWDSFPTKIIENLDIEIPTTVTDRLNFEGCIFSNSINVKGTLSNAYFLKNVIQRFYISDGNMINGIFVNCDLYTMSLTGSSTVQFINSWITDFQNNDPSNAFASFINCGINDNGGGKYLKSVQLINSIIWNANSYYYYLSLPSQSSAWNCIAVGDKCDHAFSNLSTCQNCTVAGTEIFNNGNVWEDLTDEAKTKYLGTDGTPVGRYGGIMPYDMIPAYPRITKMNVASKTTADGKLSVEIEVSAAE